MDKPSCDLVKTIFYFLTSAFLFHLSSSAKSQTFKNAPIDKSKYLVFFKNQKTEVTAKYKKIFCKKSYFLKINNKIRISPVETDSIFRVFGFNNHDTLKGYNLNGKWFFLIQNGDIKGYATRPVPLIYAATYFKKDTTFLKDNNSFRKNYLGKWVADSPKTIQLWKKQRRRHLWKAVGTPMIFITCITISIIAKPDSPLAIASWLSAIPLSLFPYVFPRIETADIVDTYNASKKLNKPNFFKDE